MRTARAVAVGWAVTLAACSLPSVGLWSTHAHADVGLYGLYGGRIAHGAFPYRPGFFMEFPPGAIPPLAVPALPHGHYIEFFHAFMAVSALVAVAAVAFALAGGSERRRLAAVVTAAVAPAVLGQITLNSLDLWPAALAGVGVAAVLRGRPRWGLALLGAASAAKLYPVLLFPVLLTYISGTYGRTEAKRALVAGAGVLTATFLPFAVFAPGGLKYSLQVQVTRGLQVESLGGSFLGVAHRLGAGFHVVVTHAPFSYDIAGSFADGLATVMSVIVLVAAFVVWRELRAGTVDRERTVRALAATAIAFVAFGKVLSPQYLLFLVPLVPLVASTLAPLLLLVALGLTQIWARFPQPFAQVSSLEGMIWVTLARNLVLVALYVVLVSGLRGSHRGAEIRTRDLQSPRLAR